MEQQRNPERQSPEVAVQIGRRIVGMTYFNTDVFYYNDNFNHMRHAFFRDGEDEEGSYIFNTDLVDTLIHEEFPSHYQPWPETQDEEAYIQHQMGNLEQRLQDGDLNL